MHHFLLSMATSTTMADRFLLLEFFFSRLLFSDVHGRSHKSAGQTEDMLAEATAMGSGLFSFIASHCCTA
jgi:hypothetical protein